MEREREGDIQNCEHKIVKILCMYVDLCNVSEIRRPAGVSDWKVLFLFLFLACTCSFVLLLRFFW